MKKALLPLFLLPLGLVSCEVVAVSAAAVIINEEFRDNAVSVIVPQSPDLVWKSTLSSLSGMTDALIHRDDNKRAATTRIDNGEVTVYVEQYDADETRVLVAAKKYLIYNHELSQIVLDRIEADLRQD